MAFHVGQKVVCVDASEHKALHAGTVYTIAAIHHEDGETFVGLLEIPRNHADWYAWRFRPVVEPKTDISIFTAMLTPKKVTEPA